MLDGQSSSLPQHIVFVFSVPLSLCDVGVAGLSRFKHGIRVAWNRPQNDIDESKSKPTATTINQKLKLS